MIQNFVRKGIKITAKLQQNSNPCDWSNHWEQWPNRDQKAHFYSLQETSSDEKSKASWEAEWGGKIFCSHGTKHSKGVMILPNPKYDIEVTKFEKDNNGRLIVLDTKMNDTNLVLMNIYSPNDISQQVQFLCLLFAYANPDTMQSCRNFDHHVI